MLTCQQMWYLACVLVRGHWCLACDRRDGHLRADQQPAAKHHVLALVVRAELHDCGLGPVWNASDQRLCCKQSLNARSPSTPTFKTDHEQFANSYIGCTVSSHQLSSATLNTARGGVFAMLWTSQGMQMWTFGRNAIPPSIKNRSSTPVLSEFGPPVANFQGSCDFDAHFVNHQMIFNTDFCGSNAGETFQMHGCPMVSCSLAGGGVCRQRHAG
jgi:hypothetical protein